MIQATDYIIGKFPDNSPLIKWDKRYPANNTCNIVWQYESMEELSIVLMIAKDAKEREMNVQLFMPYIPNARMDRVHEVDVFTLKWFAQMINSADFYRVVVFDPHSDVSVALIDRCETIRLFGKLAHVIEESKPGVIYFPDAGAMKRYENEIRDACDILDYYPRIVYGNKKRDWDTGKIVGLEVSGEVKAGEKILMVDDICSYGGTMFYSAKKLKEMGAGDIDMYVSHCENSILDKEMGHLFDDPNLIRKVYTTNSIFTGHHDKIEVMDGHWDEN